MQEQFGKIEAQLKEMDNNDSRIKKQRADLIELKDVLEKASAFFTEVRGILYKLYRCRFGYLITC